MEDPTPPDFGTYEGRERFMVATWAFVEKQAAQLGGRVPDVGQHVLALYVYDTDPRLELGNVGGQLVRVPNAAAVVGQRPHVAVVAIGPGAALRLLPAKTDPDLIDLIAFTSWACFAGLVIGKMRFVRPDGTVEVVEPWTAAAAFARGVLDGVGLDAAVPALQRISVLIAEARAAFAEALTAPPEPEPMPAATEPVGIGDMPSDAEMAAAAADLEARATAPVPATPGPRSLRRLGPPITAPAEVPP